MANAAWLLCVAGLSLCACAEVAPPRQDPPRRYVLGQSASLCFREDAEQAAALVSGENIREVAPLYSRYSSHGSVEAHLRGAMIQLRPVAGLTKERLENVIDCHRQVLAAHPGAGATSAPYALSDDQLTVTVESNRSGLAILLSCPHLEDAKVVLARASTLIGRPSPVAAK